MSSFRPSFSSPESNIATSAPLRRYARLFLYAVGVALLLFLLPIPFTRPILQGPLGGSLDHLVAIRNETLGFHKVFAINLPVRADKRDNIALGSSVSDFLVEWIDGVTPDQVSPLSYPYNWNYDHEPAEYAARRAHVNGMRRIIDERLGSAIIMEDDADWDVSIKTQLQNLALAVRALQGTPSSPPSSSPYGDDWDILWLGHCGLECRTDLPFYLTPNDPTILPPHHFLPYWRDPPPIDRPDHTRLTCTIGDGACSIVYVVSYCGAQRILSALSVNPEGIAEKIDIGAQFDVSLGRMCGSDYLRCFATYPSLTGGYHPAGPATKGSDIHNPDGKVEGENLPASSYGVMYSTLMNVNRILRGEETVHSNWDDAPMREVNPNDIPVLEGGVSALGNNP